MKAYCPLVNGVVDDGLWDARPCVNEVPFQVGVHVGRAEVVTLNICYN